VRFCFDANQECQRAAAGAARETGVEEQVERDMISWCHVDAAEAEQALRTPECCTPGEKEW
jgi:hypothetical protein